MYPLKCYCANQRNGACIYPAEGLFDPADYFADPCYGHQVSPAGSTIACPRYLPPYLAKDNNPIARITTYDTPFTVPSAGIRFEFNDGDADAPAESYPGESDEDTGAVDDGAPEASSFTGDSSLSSADDAFNGMVLTFTSGALDGESREVSDYEGSTRTFTMSTAFSGAPADEDTFSIENLAVVPQVAWYSESGYALGVESADGIYGIKYVGKFYAVESGNYQFMFVGHGQANFTINSTYYLGADATDFEDLPPKEYTILPSAGTIALTAGTWYDFEIRYRRVDTMTPAGLCVLWRNDQSWWRPTVLSAGVCAFTGEFLEAEAVEDYDALEVSRASDAEVSEATFAISLNASGEARGYTYDEDTRSLEHNGGGPSLKPNRLMEIETGYRTEGGSSDYDQYRKILVGHMVKPESSRAPQSADSTKITVRDFGHLLRETHVENYPEELDYWIAGYIGKDRPNGGNAPVAWDAWELDRVFEVLLIRGGVDPVLLRTRRLYFGPEETAVQGERLLGEAHPHVVLESQANYGNPEIVIEPTSETQERIDQKYFWGPEYGEKLLDVLNKLADNYGWQWGFHAGYGVMPGTLDFTGGPYLIAKGNALYTVQGLSDWNLLWFGNFEGDDRYFEGNLIRVGDTTEDATPQVDTGVVHDGSQSLRFAAAEEGVLLGTFQFQSGQVWAITFWAYYDAGGGSDTDVVLRVDSRWAEHDEFHPWDETLFEQVESPGDTDINGDSTWRRYQAILTCEDDEVVDLKAYVNTALDPNSNLYLDGLQMVAMRKTTSTLRDFKDYDFLTGDHPLAIRGEYLLGDYDNYPEEENTTFYLPFRGTRVDVVTVPGADLSDSGDHIRLRLYKSSDDALMQDEDGNDYDTSINQYHAGPEAGRDEWFYYDGVDSSGENPTVTKLADGLPLDDYYVKVEFLKETPRLDALLVYGLDRGAALTVPGVPDMTYRTQQDDSEPFQPGTIGDLDVTVLSGDQRNDCIVVGAALGLWVPDEQNPDVVVDPLNPIEQYVYARAIDRDSMFKPGAVNYMGRRSQAVVVEPGISSNDRAKWLASFLVEQNQLAGQKIGAQALHSPLLDPGDTLKILDSRKSVVHTDVINLGDIESQVGKSTVDNLEGDTLKLPGSYVPRFDRDLGVFGGEFMQDVLFYNNGNILGVLNTQVLDSGTSAIVDIPGTGPGSEEVSFPDRGYLLIEGNDEADRQTWEFIHYTTIIRGSGTVTLVWTDNNLHRALEYRQRQMKDDDETWLYDTAASPVQHDAESRVFVPYDPYLSEESPPQRVKIEAKLLQAGYLRVELRQAFPDSSGREGKAPATILVANLTNTGTDTTESGVGERFYDPGTYAWFWDGVGSKTWNERCSELAQEEDSVGAGYYAAEYQPTTEWMDNGGQPSSEGGPFLERVYERFQVVFHLRTLAGKTYTQEIDSDYVYTRRGPKIEEIIPRYWADGQEWPDADGWAATKWATATAPGTRYVDTNNRDWAGHPKGLLLQYERDATSRVEGQRKIHLAYLDVSVYRYVEVRHTDPTQVYQIYSGLKVFSYGQFEISVLTRGDDKWLFALKPQTEFVFHGHIEETLVGDPAKYYQEWLEDGKAAVYGAWLLQVKPSVIDRSGRRADLEYLYFQWCGNGVSRKTIFEVPHNYQADNAFRTDRLYPAHPGRNTHFIELPTGEPGETKEWYWWVHRLI